MKDSLGDRMKGNYESRFKQKLPRRNYIIIRLDGKAFHTYTKGLNRPFDIDFINDMDLTAKYLCENVSGVKCAFVQSDEISLVITDFDKLETQSWLDNNIQKMTSISASMATKAFNKARLESLGAEGMKWAEFDSRVFIMPNLTEVINYLIWRQQDTVRNSIQSVAQSLYSQKELHGKNTNMLQELIFQKGINWNEYDAGLKRGRIVFKTCDQNGRTFWGINGAPMFSKDRDFVKNIVPNRDAPDFSDAIKVVCEHLKNDPDLFESYKANIAVAFQDMYNGKDKPEDIHRMSNEAATNFLNNLING